MESSKAGSVQIRFSSHPSEEIWEEYAFGRLDESHLAPLEEHLLVCMECQETLEGVDTFIATVKSGAAAMQTSQREPFWSRWLRPAPRVAIAFGAAVLVAGVAIAATLYSSQTFLSTAPLAVVALQSFRGDNLQTVPAGHLLELQVPAADVAAGSNFRLEVVTSSGSKIWNGKAGVTRVPRGLGRGTYFVRLYGSDGELLREYSLRVE